MPMADGGRLARVNQLRRDDLTNCRLLIDRVIRCLKGETGRAESAELTLAIRDLETADFRILQHLTLLGE